jgi:tight adherence protein B
MTMLIAGLAGLCTLCALFAVRQWMVERTHVPDVGLLNDIGRGLPLDTLPIVRVPSHDPQGVLGLIEATWAPLLRWTARTGVPRSITLVAVGLAAAMAAGTLTALGLPLPVVAIGGLALVLGPPIRVARARRLRRQRFERLFPDTLELMSRSLRAGHALLESLDLVAQEAAEPIKSEFTRVVQEVRFGVSLPAALTAMAHRVESRELNFFVTSLLIQRETGGNLAGIIDFISELTRKRFELELKIRAVSAEGRLSVGVIFALPFVVAGLLWALNPDYLTPLSQDPVGRLVAGAGLALALIGLVITRRMVTLKG